MRFNNIAGKRKDGMRIDPDLPKIEEGWNFRLKSNILDGIEALGRDMFENGQKQAVIVRCPGDDVFVVAGERRTRAGQWIKANLDPNWLLLCMPEDPKADAKARLFTQLSENSGKPFTYLEKARLYQKLRSEGATQEEIANRGQTTKQAVSRALMLVEKGSNHLLSLVEQEKMTGTVALKIIDAYPDDHAMQDKVADEALATAEAAGKDSVSPKHLTKPEKPANLSFAFGRGLCRDGFHRINAHGVATEPDTCDVTLPKTWKVGTVQLRIAHLKVYGKWVTAFRTDHNSHLPAERPENQPMFDSEREAWLAAWAEGIGNQALYFRDDHKNAQSDSLASAATRQLFEETLDVFLAGKLAPPTPGILSFEFKPGLRLDEGFHEVNEHGVIIDEDECHITAPKSWKLTNLALRIGQPKQTGKWSFATDHHTPTSGGGGPCSADRATISEERDAWLAAWDQLIPLAVDAHTRNNKLQLAEKINNPALRAEFIAALDQYLSCKGAAAGAADNSAGAESHSSDSAPDLRFRRMLIVGPPEEPMADGSLAEDTILVLENLWQDCGLERLHLLSRETHSGKAYGYRINERVRLPHPGDEETVGLPVEAGFPVALELALEAGMLPIDGKGLRDDLGQLLGDAIKRYYATDGTAEEPDTVNYTDLPDELKLPLPAPAMTFRGHLLTGRPPEPDKTGDYQEQYRFVLTGIPVQCPLEFFHLLLAPLTAETDGWAVGWRYKLNGTMEEVLPSQAVDERIVDANLSSTHLISDILGEALDETGVADAWTSQAEEAWRHAVKTYLDELGELDSSLMGALQWVAKADPSAFEKIKDAEKTNRDGSGVRHGNDGGFVSPDKRLKQAEEILNKLDGEGVAERVTTMEVVLRFIMNESSPSALKAWLTGKA